MNTVLLRRWMVCTALGLFALVTTGCSESRQMVRSELELPAEALKAALAQGPGGNVPHYELLLVRLEAYPVRVEASEGEPFPADYGDPAKRAVATTEILGTTLMAQLEQCEPIDATCSVFVPFLVPSVTPLEIRAYLFWQNNHDVESYDPYIPFVLNTELMFGSTLFTGANAAGTSAQQQAAPTGVSSSDGPVPSASIDLAFWDETMSQLPPPAGYGQSGQGPGYADVTGDVSVGAANAQSDCAEMAGPLPTSWATTVIAWDEQFGVPYIGTNTAAATCGSAGCYSLSDGWDPNFGAPVDREVRLFGLFTGYGVDDLGNILGVGYSRLNGTATDFMDVWPSFDGAVFAEVPHIGLQGLGSEPLYVQSSGNTQDMELTGCPREARVAMNFNEEIYVSSNATTGGVNVDGTSSTLLPLSLPALANAAENGTEYFGTTMAVGNRAISYGYDSGGSFLGTSSGGLMLTGQSANAFIFDSGGGQLNGRGQIIGGPAPSPTPTAWNTFQVPTFGIPYPGGAAWQKSHLIVTNLMDPNDPCEVLQFDTTPCYFSEPLNSEFYFDPEFGEPISASHICDPNPDPENPESCQRVPSVKFDNVDLNPNNPVNVANIAVRRFNPPTACGVDPSAPYLIVEHPFQAGSPGSFRLAGMKLGQSTPRGGESIDCYPANPSSNPLPVGYTEEWRSRNVWECDSQYFVSSGGSIQPGDNVALSASTRNDPFDPFYSMGGNWGSTPVNLTCDASVEGVLLAGAGRDGVSGPLTVIDPYVSDSAGSSGLYQMTSSLGVPVSGLSIDPNDFGSGFLTGTPVVNGCAVYASEMFVASSAGMQVYDTSGWVNAGGYQIDDGGTPFGDIKDLTFDPNTGEILATQSGNLYDINPGTGSASLRGTGLSSIDTATSIAMTPDGSTMYAVMALSDGFDAEGDLVIANASNGTFDESSRVPLDPSALSCGSGMLAGVTGSCDLMSMTFSNDGRLFGLVYADDGFSFQMTYLVEINPVSGVLDIVRRVDPSQYHSEIAWVPPACQVFVGGGF